MKILFTGGGTAGHIFPIIAVAREIKAKYQGQDLELFYFGPKDNFSEKLLPKEGIRVKIILAGKIRRYFGIISFLQNIFDIFFKAPIGFLQAFFHIFLISPDLIFSKGGYGSLPTVLAGWLLLTPIFLHESDITPGLANRILSRFSLEIFVSFPAEKTKYFPPKKMISVGNPVRLELLPAFTKIQEPKKPLKLKGGKPIILITGGSQGSQRINDVVLAVLGELVSDFELLHQVGAKNLKQITAESKIVIPKELQEYYHIFGFLEESELKQAYEEASLVVARAGSGTIFEIAALSKASLLIPLKESAQNHQMENGYAFSESGACQILEEDNLTPHFFLERVRYLFSQPDKLKKMEQAAKSFSRPFSAKIIAEYLVEYLLT